MKRHQQMIYHIMLDRFFPSGSEDPNGNFKGGCIKDVIRHLDYIQELGMTGILLTPFYHTASYHGYHTVDFDSVDPHFGTWEDIKTLVNEVHKRGMSITADFVANHCHSSNKLYRDKTHASWFKKDNKGNQQYYAGISELPMFETDNKDVRNFLVEQALVLCKIGFDALRLDHAAGPSYQFWSYFRSRIKKSYPNVSLIGEVWGSMDFKPNNRLRYWINSHLYSPQEARQLEYVGVLDGVLDFKYQQLVCDACHAKETFTKKSKVYGKAKRHIKRYPKDFQLWLFLDNHDLNRILFECNFDSELVKKAIEFSCQWGEPFLMFYGTEKELTNTKNIFDGTPYADERVRMPLTNN